MVDLFLKIANMSITASWMILAVLIFRFFLKKAPKWVNILLWGMVAVRLAVPISLESFLSLIPKAQVIVPEVTPQPLPEIPVGDISYNNVITPTPMAPMDPVPTTTVVEPSPVLNWTAIITAIWILGAVVLAVYGLISYLRLHRRVQTAIHEDNHIYRCDTVAFPFILGLLKPRIYLPFAISERDVTHVIAHERAHIARKDHWWKPLGFALLTIHWFNPLVWLAYILLCRDIELACDEKVIRNLGPQQRADYSQTLLSCSIKRKTINACPLAFGDGGVKERVKTVLYYKKPAFLIIVSAITACAVIAVCFLTNPKENVTALSSPDDRIFSNPADDLVFLNSANDNAAEDYTNKMLSVMVQTNQRNTTYACKWYYSQIRKSETYTISSLKTYKLYFSIQNINKESIELNLNSKFPLTQNGQEVTSIKLKYGESIKLEYHKGYTHISYTFSIIDVKNSGFDQPLEALISDYSLEQAKQDGCVVMENVDVTSGQEIWQEFVQQTINGNAASVRVVHHYNYPDFEIEGIFPCMDVHELTFDGNEYTLRFYGKDGQINVRSFKYLLQSTSYAESPDFPYQSRLRYLLVNDNTVTWEDIYNAKQTCYNWDDIYYYEIYTDLIYADGASISDLEKAKSALEPYMNQYQIAILDANEATGTVDITVREMVDGLEEFVTEHIDLKYVRIFLLEGELSLTN